LYPNAADWIKFLLDQPFILSFLLPLLLAVGVMGRRAKNKQGDPLPLHADPDLNGSWKSSTAKSKPGHKKSSAPNLKAKLGKRKPERDDYGERVTKKPKGVLPAGKSEPQAKAMPIKRPDAKGQGKSKGREVDPEENEDEVISMGWEDEEDVDVRAEARCVRLPDNADGLPNRRVTQQVIVPR
jgi:hypothetical protein